MQSTLYAFIYLVAVYVCVTNGQGGSDFCCNALNGNWTNELKSEMTLTCDGSGGLNGTYDSAVGQAEKKYTLSGRYTVGTDHYSCILGWTVSWNNQYGNSESATAWSGIYFESAKTIFTQWLLTRNTKFNNKWASTMVNHDEFKRSGTIDPRKTDL